MSGVSSSIRSVYATSSTDDSVIYLLNSIYLLVVSYRQGEHSIVGSRATVFHRVVKYKCDWYKKSLRYRFSHMTFFASDRLLVFCMQVLRLWLQSVPRGFVKRA